MAADNKVDLNQESVDTGDNKSNISLEQFFSGLEKEVNGAIYEEDAENNTSVNPDDGEGVEPDGDSQDTKVAPDDLQKQFDNLQSRYESSSREAKRLARELQKYNEVDDMLPLINVMKQDPSLLRQIRSYLEEGVSPQDAMKDLKLGDDFIFDPDEAIKDPDSDSAKVFNRIIQSEVDRKLSAQRAEAETQSHEYNKQRKAFEDFAAANNIPSDELEDFINWAQEEKMTLDHLWYLKNRGKRDGEILKNSIKDRDAQINKMKNTPRSLANTGATGTSEDDPDTAVFKGIMNSLGQGIFGGLD
jgi:TolA-binding protein